MNGVPFSFEPLLWPWPWPAPEERRRNWLELPREVTASIMSRLIAVDIFANVQLVCKAWLDIARDPLVWRKIDMYNEGFPNRDDDLDAMCRCAVDRSSGALADINIEYFGSDDLLKFIADRPNKITRLRLACCVLVSDEGLIDALKKLPLLEEIDLTLCPFSEQPIHAMGSFCWNLKSFRLNGEPYRSEEMTSEEEEEFNMHVYAISASMPRLRHLQLIGNLMTNKGLEAILDGCPELESLDLRKCLNVMTEGDVWKRCTRQIKQLYLPHQSTYTDYDYSTGDDSSFDTESLESSGSGDSYLERLCEGQESYTEAPWLAAPTPFWGDEYD